MPIKLFFQCQCFLFQFRMPKCNWLFLSSQSSHSQHWQLLCVWVITRALQCRTTDVMRFGMQPFLFLSSVELFLHQYILYFSIFQLMLSWQLQCIEDLKAQYPQDACHYVMVLLKYSIIELYFYRRVYFFGSFTQCLVSARWNRVTFYHPDSGNDGVCILKKSRRTWTDNGTVMHNCGLWQSTLLSHTSWSHNRKDGNCH